MTLHHSPEALWLIAAKALGALGGSAISLAYVLPRGRREAALRFLTGVVAGMVFGPLAGLKLAAHLGVAGQLSSFEPATAGSAAVSLCAWWALGVLARFARRHGGRLPRF